MHAPFPVVDGIALASWGISATPLPRVKGVRAQAVCAK
jgi:hypothetical protein